MPFAIISSSNILGIKFGIGDVLLVSVSSKSLSLGYSATGVL